MPTRRTCLAALALTLGGCSYRPLYSGGSTGPVAGRLSGIAVVEQRTRAGQLLRNELISAIDPPGPGRETQYRLSLEVKEREIFVSSLPKEPVTRKRLSLIARYALVDLSTGKTVSQGSSQSAVGFDTVREPIADLQSRNAAMQRAAIEAAQDIRLRLSAFFARA